MTCIAWDGVTLAADRRAVQGGYTYPVTKIFRVGDRLVGFSGRMDRAGEFLAWLRTGAYPSTYPQNTEEGHSTYFVAIRRDGTVERYESTGYPIIVEQRHFAVGSGRDYATAAMHLGCTAKQAVEVACSFDENCGNGVDTLTLADLEPTSS